MIPKFIIRSCVFYHEMTQSYSHTYCKVKLVWKMRISYITFEWSYITRIIVNLLERYFQLYNLIKSRSTAYAQLSAYAHWLQTHRQTPYTGNDPYCSLLDIQTDRRTDGRTDATKYIISLASRSIISGQQKYQINHSCHSKTEISNMKILFVCPARY